MSKIRKISISRGGLKIAKLNVDTETIAFVVPDEDSEVVKDLYVRKLKEQGIIVRHDQDIHYKKPWWKFWAMNDYTLAVYKIQNLPS